LVSVFCDCANNIPVASAEMTARNFRGLINIVFSCAFKAH
jgi:hypothetical protein